MSARPPFRLLDVRWTPRVNLYDVGCYCGAEFSHPANRANVRCPRCGARGSVSEIREQRVPTAREDDRPRPLAARYREPMLPGLEDDRA